MSCRPPPAHLACARTQCQAHLHGLSLTMVGPISFIQLTMVRHLLCIRLRVRDIYNRRGRRGEGWGCVDLVRE